MDNLRERLELKKSLARQQGRGAVIDAHKHSANHRAEVLASDVAGCFYCCKTFSPAKIDEWVDEGGCALCPNCGIDSVIGSASGYPVQDGSFLKAMNEFWFS